MKRKCLQFRWRWLFGWLFVSVFYGIWSVLRDGMIRGILGFKMGVWGICGCGLGRIFGSRFFDPCCWKRG